MNILTTEFKIKQNKTLTDIFFCFQPSQQIKVFEFPISENHRRFQICMCHLSYLHFYTVLHIMFTFQVQELNFSNLVIRQWSVDIDG